MQGNLGNYRDYFHIFPHNLGATSLLGLLFSIGAALGIYLFLLLWEANSRYIINFIPVFVICAVYSFPDAYRVLTALRRTLLDTLRPHDEAEAA